MGGPQLRVEDERGRGNQVVRIVDLAVGAPVLARQRAGRSREALVHGNPRRREELLERFQFVVSNPREELEADDLAGGNGLLLDDAGCAPRRWSIATLVSGSLTDSARRKIERDLHDGAQQQFVAVALRMRLLVSQLEKSAPQAAPLVSGALEELQRAIDELREIARGIHPAVLTERGLARAVEALVGRMPIAVKLCDGPEERLPEPVEAAFYYVIREPQNACKHAEASAVSVDIGRSNGHAWVEVVDDGVGGATLGEGSGLGGLVDRVEALDGSFEVVSPRGEGTTVRAEVPCA